MKPQKIFLLLFIIFSLSLRLTAWTSSNEGVCYTMDTLVQLSNDITYNTIDQMYEVDCDIIILENDTLKILPGEIVKFLSYPGGPPIRYELTIYGNLIAIGEEDKIIVLGDPQATLSTGHWWQGIKFLNTSQNGESILKYCDIRGAVNLEVYLETAILCENSSPIFDHCIFQYIGSSEEEGGASAIGLRNQSYPMVNYCDFQYIVNGVAIWCNPYSIQDTFDFPSPLMVGCNIMPSVNGIYWPQCDGDKVVLYGGFMDNCYLGVSANIADTTLGYPVDTIGDDYCNTTSTFDLHPRFLLVDGVANPRNSPVITGINEIETELVYTTSNYLTLNNNYPNPFTEYTTIEFIVNNDETHIDLLIFDSKGNLVNKMIEDEFYPKGTHKINWYGNDESGQLVASGIYFYKLVSGNEIKVKKAILVK